MSKIIWNSSLSVNVQEIDQQHRQLIDTINKLDDAMQQGKGKDVLGAILDSLVRYTKSHFSTEEDLMNRHSFPGLANHRNEHERLLGKVGEFQEQMKSGRVGLTIPVMNFLTNWLTRHILDTDKQYSAHLNGKGVR